MDPLTLDDWNTHLNALEAESGDKVYFFHDQLEDPCKNLELACESLSAFDFKAKASCRSKEDTGWLILCTPAPADTEA